MKVMGRVRVRGRVKVRVRVEDDLVEVLVHLPGGLAQGGVQDEVWTEGGGRRIGRGREGECREEGG